MTSGHPSVAIYPAHPTQLAAAQAWALQFNLPLVSHPVGVDWLIRVTPTHAELVSLQEKHFAPLWIDFMQGKLNFRALERGASQELIAKAVGVKRDYHPRVLDVTAGWGRDAFLLTTLGCQVVMVERSPIMALLLQDALNRLFAGEDAPAAQIFSLVTGQAEAVLRQGSCEAEVIYLDPMYPERVKSALVKKEMRILRELVGADEDTVSLFNLALQKATKRVVVKRPLHSGYLDDKKPHFQYLGRSTRFDVYTCMPETIQCSP